jgi:hypothetical protein
VVLAGAALGLPATAAAKGTDATTAAHHASPDVLLRAPAADGTSLLASRRAHRADRLRAQVVQLKRRLDKAQGHRVRVVSTRRHAAHASVPQLRHRIRVLEQRLRAAEAAPASSSASASAPSGTLQAIAACESGGNPSAVGGGGLYRGKYQFDQQTWESVGGTGDPASAPVAEQDRLAAILYAREGSTPWPVCGR